MRLFVCVVQGFWEGRWEDQMLEVEMTMDKDALLREAQAMLGGIQECYSVILSPETIRHIDLLCDRITATLSEPQGDGCRWTEDEYEGGAWDTDCGEKFCIEDGTPEQNDMKFCCYCGHKILPPLPKE